MKKIICLLTLCFVTISVAQNSYKYEKESRIKEADFPKNALNLMRTNLPEKVRRIRHYIEQDSTKISYETKLKFKGNNYSIEFSREGILEDVEVKIRKRNIPDAVLEKIESYLNGTYDSYRMKKIQRHYPNNQSNPEKVMKNAFSGDMKSDFLYEIIAEVKQSKKRYFVEITFSKEGNFILVRTVIRSSYDHILY